LKLSTHKHAGSHYYCHYYYKMTRNLGESETWGRPAPWVRLWDKLGG